MKMKKTYYIQAIRKFGKIKKKLIKYNRQISRINYIV